MLFLSHMVLQSELFDLISCAGPAELVDDVTGGLKLL